MTIFIPVVDVRCAVIVEILAGALNAVVKTLPLNFTELRGRRIPPTRFLSIC
jgi:hypothetical protein